MSFLIGWNYFISENIIVSKSTKKASTHKFQLNNKNSNANIQFTFIIFVFLD
jgi:hypothetical protein